MVNAHNQAFGFSLAICLNCLLYIFKWCEVLLAPEPTQGAKVLAEFMVMSYAIEFTIFGWAALVARYGTDENDLSKEGGRTCLYLWAAGVIVYYALNNIW